MWGIIITLDIVGIDPSGRPHARTCKNNRTCIIHNLTGLVLIQTESFQSACNQTTRRQKMRRSVKMLQYSTWSPPNTEWAATYATVSCGLLVAGLPQSGRSFGLELSKLSSSGAAPSSLVVRGWSCLRHVFTLYATCINSLHCSCTTYQADAASSTLSIITLLYHCLKSTNIINHA